VIRAICCGSASVSCRWNSHYEAFVWPFVSALSVGDDGESGLLMIDGRGRSPRLSHGCVQYSI